jgi:hypothetical protein
MFGPRRKLVIHPIAVALSGNCSSREVKLLRVETVRNGRVVGLDSVNSFSSRIWALPLCDLSAQSDVKLSRRKYVELSLHERMSICRAGDGGLLDTFVSGWVLALLAGVFRFNAACTW